MNKSPDTDANQGNENDPDPRTAWAEARTDWAEDRTILANERTFAGWMRTGMASLAVAIGLRAVFGPFEPTWMAKAVATVFVIISIAVYWVARQQACGALERLERHQARPLDTRRLSWIAGLLAAGSFFVGVVLWMI